MAVRHPSTYMHSELEQILCVERLDVTQRLSAVKRQQRALAERREQLERRLREMSRVGDMLADGELPQRHAAALAPVGPLMAASVYTYRHSGLSPDAWRDSWRAALAAVADFCMSGAAPTIQATNTRSGSPNAAA